MKKFLSYFFPVTKKIPTEYNGTVELTYYNGRKILNSAHANYSYDSLQRVLKFGLTKIDLSKASTILLLGLGGGCVIRTLTDDFNFTGKVTAVELDKAIIEIAEQEFNILPGNNLEIIHADAFEFVKNDKSKYDLIIIDLFIDTVVPEVFHSSGFWNYINLLINPGGYFIFNAAVSFTNEKIPLLMNELKKDFRLSRHDKVEGNNILLTGKKLN